MDRVRRDSQIRTERCLVRAPRHGDYAAWADLRRASRRFLEPWEPLWPGDALTHSDWKRRMRAWRAGWATDRSYVFLIFDRQERELLGGASLSHIRRGPAMTASLGYWLGADAEGHGYMAETVNAICAWAADVLALERIEAATVPENARSQNVLGRCGFEREGYARAYLEIAGRRRDHVLFARNLRPVASDPGTAGEMP